MKLRGLIRTCAVLAGCSLLVVMAPVRAQEPSAPEPEQPSAPGTRSFDVRSGGLATGLYLAVSRPLTLPFDPLVPASLAAAEGAIDDATGETVSFASALYPGDVLANAGGLMGLVGFPIGGTVLPPDHPISDLYASIPNLIPPWPFEARASHPDKPGERVDLASELTRSVVPLPIPVVVEGLVQDANAAEGFAGSSATFGRVQVNTPLGAIPGLDVAITALRPLLAPLLGDIDPLTGYLVDIAGLRSSYNATVSAVGAEVTSQTEASSIGLLGGLLQLADVEATVTLRSDGTSVEVVEQGYDIGAVSLAGVEVRIDESGVSVSDGRIPIGSTGVIEDLLNRLLDSVEQAGVHIELPKLTEEGASRGVQLLELRVRADNPAIPFVLPEGSAAVTLRIGEVGARLETFPRPPAPDTPTIGDQPDGGAVAVSGDPGGPSSVAPPASSASPPPEPQDSGSGGLAAGPSKTPSGTPIDTGSTPLTVAQLVALEVGDLIRRLVLLVSFAGVAVAFGWRRRLGFR